MTRLRCPYSFTRAVPVGCPIHIGPGGSDEVEGRDAASALSVKAGATSWDARLFWILNQVPPAAASVLTPLSHLFGPAGIIAVVLLTVVYVVARNRSVLPVAAAAAA